MNAFPSGCNDRAEAQAALWAAKIDGDSLDAADRATLDTWLNSDPQHRALLSQYRRFSADLDDRVPLLVASGAVVPPASRQAARPRITPGFLLAGSLAAAVAIACFVWPASPKVQTETIATSGAQRRALDLADGTRVELNARTGILVQLTARERRVRMPDGQALFTVAHDGARPFIVDTPAGSVRVTGTVFDVRTESAAELSVTVVEGSVQVSPHRTAGDRSSASVALHACDQLTATGGAVNVRTLSAAEVDDVLAWRRGEVVFEGTPLGTALAQLARHHGRTIVVAPEIQKLRVGGRFNLDNLDEFLTAIEAVLPVRVSRASSGVIAVTPRAGS